MNVIIFKTDTSGVAVIVPAPSWNGTLEQLAAKDVPPNTPWRVIDSSELPSDRTFRDAWEWED